MSIKCTLETPSKLSDIFGTDTWQFRLPFTQVQLNSVFCVVGETTLWTGNLASFHIERATRKTPVSCSHNMIGLSIAENGMLTLQYLSRAWAKGHALEFSVK